MNRLIKTVLAALLLVVSVIAVAQDNSFESVGIITSINYTTHQVVIEGQTYTLSRQTHVAGENSNFDPIGQLEQGMLISFSGTKSKGDGGMITGLAILQRHADQLGQ